MPKRKSTESKPIPSREQVIARSRRRFVEADIQIADLEAEGRKRQRDALAKKEKGGT
jgi:hypothetical protein